MTIPTPEPGAATTPIYGWHVPTSGDAPNVPYDVTQTALAIESTVDLHERRYVANGLPGIRIEGGTDVKTISNGEMTINYRVTFSSVVHPVLTIGDVTSNAAVLLIVSPTASSVRFRLFTSTGAPATGLVRVNYVAIGPYTAPAGE